jgi:hypothetical protein
MSSGLELMKITGYTDENFQNSFNSSPYTVMINPESLKWDRSIEYNEKQSPDSSSASQKYKSTPSETISFDIVIDCVGIVDSSRIDLNAEIEHLESVVYTYNGTIHRPNFVKVSWGKDLIFKGVLKSFDTSYSLFRPDGSPLRAKVSLSFSEYISPDQVAKTDQDESPDITHLITVVDGDTLPGLCEKVWNDNSYYIQVAQYNGLNKFRNLQGVAELLFPPIIQDT